MTVNGWYDVNFDLAISRLKELNEELARCCEGSGSDGSQFSHDAGMWISDYGGVSLVALQILQDVLEFRKSRKEPECLKP